MLDLDISQAVLLGLVPEYAIDSGSRFGFVPRALGICLVVSVLLQDHGDNVGKHFCGVLVALLPGKDHGTRKIVLEVRVLIDHAVEQPGACRSGVILIAGITGEPFPMVIFPPFLCIEDPLCQLLLGLLVFLEGSKRLFYGVFRDRRIEFQRHSRLFRYDRLISCRWLHGASYPAFPPSCYVSCHVCLLIL